MKLALALLAAAPAYAAISDMSIPVDSKQGAALLNKARLLAEAEENTTWMVDYAIKFSSCHEIATIGGEGGGEENEGASAVQRLVTLKLCPKSSCASSCRGGAEYVVELREFLETYTQMKEEMDEAKCESAENTCEYECQYNQNQNRWLEDADQDADENNNNNNNNNNNEDYCSYKCMVDAGHTDCEVVQEYEQQQNGNNNNQQQAEEIDYSRFAECEALDDGNEYGNAAYVGAYCSSNGKAVNLGVFTDAACTVKGDDSLFQTYFYTPLPYTKKSLIGKDCLSCDAQDYEAQDNNNDGNNNNNNYNYEVSEVCEQVHERSAKCEKKLKLSDSMYYTPHTESCAFIHRTLPALQSVTKSNGRSLSTARFFSWFFFLTTAAAAGYIFYIHKGKKSRTVDLAAQDGGTQA